MSRILMSVNLRRAVLSCGAFGLVSLWGLTAARAQKSVDLPAEPSPQVGAFYAPGGAVVERATPGAMPLSLDEAIELGLRHNLQLELARQNQRMVHGEVLTVANNLLPGMTAKVYSRAQEINLAAMGFKPAALSGFGLPAGAFHEIVKVNTTVAQLNVNQQLFNVPAYYLYRAAQKADAVATLTSRNVEGGLVLQVGSQYLLALADASQVENAKTLERADEVVLRQATASHDAGVGTNLDVLRARVQLQMQQQAVIHSEATAAKDRISLNRTMGLPADQEVNLTDTVPYAEFTQLPLEDAKSLAFEHRKDLLSLNAQMDVADRARKAVRYQRLPSLSFDGFYGVLGETTGLYHGVFSATGKLSVPIFEEGQLRGEREVAEAQRLGLRHQIASLRVTIEAQIRSAMLDVQSSSELVKVARSNVDLSTEELQQASDRFAAGVDDNLPVVEAQAVLAAAQNRLVGALFQFNQSKLTLARNTGVVESQYKAYLGR